MPFPIRHNLKQALIAFDQLCNAILCPIFCPSEQSWADETLSSRAWRWELSGKRSWPREIIDAVASVFGDPNHCKESFESERMGRQLPPEARPQW